MANKKNYKLLPRFTVYLIIILALCTSSCLSLFHAKLLGFAQPLPPLAAPTTTGRLLFIPLDSRPACTDYVQKLAKLANLEVIMPPQELLDNYHTPANRQGLRDWLYTASKNADYALLAVDSLVHGGLMASRVPIGSPADFTQTVELLQLIHQENPTLQIHAFNIIPRLLLPDHLFSADIQAKMLTYSILKDKLGSSEEQLQIKSQTEAPAKRQAEQEQLANLEQELPPAVIASYLSLYQQNDLVNKQLCQLTAAGVLTSLVIGQDDGQPFGLPNANKVKAEQYATSSSLLTDKVFVTRGADEVAMSQLAHLVSRKNKQSPKVYVTYSQQDTPTLMMPYMPHNVAKTATEKIALTGCQETLFPAAADFILYIHIGTATTTASQLKTNAQTVSNLLHLGRNVALVDMTEDFFANTTLLPVLIANNDNIAQLTAYAGWNTISNSVGTALSQATIFTQTLANSGKTADTLQAWQLNLEFLTSRFLEDWYFQREIHPLIIQHLRRSHQDPNKLPTADPAVDKQISRLLAEDANALLRRALWLKPINITTPDGPKQLVITSLQIKTSLPWRRVFEVRLQPKLELAVPCQ